MWGLLLLRLAEDVDRPSRLVGDIRNIHAARFSLANVFDLLKVLLRQLNFLEILVDTCWCDGFGYHAMFADLGPGKNDLRGSSANAAGHFFDCVVMNEQGNVEHVVAKCL